MVRAATLRDSWLTPLVECRPLDLRGGARAAQRRRSERRGINSKAARLRVRGVWLKHRRVWFYPSFSFLSTHCTVRFLFYYLRPPLPLSLLLYGTRVQCIVCTPLRPCRPCSPRRASPVGPRETTSTLHNPLTHSTAGFFVLQQSQEIFSRSPFRAPHPRRGARRRAWSTPTRF